MAKLPNIDDIKNNLGYSTIVWPDYFELERDNGNHWSHFYADASELYMKRKLSVFFDYPTNLAPHEKEEFLRQSIRKSVDEYKANKANLTSPYATNKSTRLSPLEYIVRQTIALRFINHTKEYSLDNPDKKKYTAEDLETELENAVFASFNPELFFVPRIETLETISPLIKNITYARVQGQLKKSSEFDDFDFQTYLEALNYYALDTCRDISRIFQEFWIDTIDADTIYDEVRYTLDIEAQITNEPDPEKHLEKAATNCFFQSGFNGNPITFLDDETAPRYDFIALRDRAYYDEFLFAYYRTLDAEHTNRETFKTMLANGKEVCSVDNNMWLNLSDEKSKEFFKIAQQTFDKFQEKLTNKTMTPPTDNSEYKPSIHNFLKIIDIKPQ